MFCLKCGKEMDGNVCKHCGVSDTLYHGHNYLKSQEMQDLLCDDSDFNCISGNETVAVENEPIQIHHEVKNEKPSVSSITTKTADESEMKKQPEDAVLRKWSRMSNAGKNVIIIIIIILIIAIGSISLAYTSLLKKYHSLEEKTKENNISVDLDDNGAEIGSNESDINDDSPEFSETDETIMQVIEEETDNIIDVSAKAEERDDQAVQLNNLVNDNKYDKAQLDDMIESYKNKKPIMQFEDDFNCSDDQSQYDIEYAEACLNDKTKQWDDKISCGTLSKDHKEICMYYFEVKDTKGKQYVLAEKDDVPGTDDMVYIESIKGYDNCYYMARQRNKQSDIYFVMDNKIYEFIEFEEEDSKTSTERKGVYGE